MNLPDQPVREWEPSSQPLQAVVERRDVVRDFHDIIERYAWRLIQFKKQKIRERIVSPRSATRPLLLFRT